MAAFDSLSATTSSIDDIIPYYRRSPEISRVLKLIARGLLYASTDTDPVIRQSALPYLRGTSDIFIGLLSMDAKLSSLSHLRFGNQSPPIDPLEFIYALTAVIDLTHWAISSLAIQVSKLVKTTVQ